ncbi:MAG: hypothetical protein ACI3Y0_13855 [Prevotella sp.]
MQQTDRGQYQKKQPWVDLFLRSCLGKIIIIVILTGLVLLAAMYTVPSKAKMEQELTDDIQQCIEECQGNAADVSDDIVRNTMSIFTHADSIPDTETMNTFWNHNRIEFYPHTFFSTAYLYNNAIPNGKRAAVGIFGMVIPMLKYTDFIMRMAPMRKDYNQRIIKNEFSIDNDVENDPDFGNTYNTYQ